MTGAYLTVAAKGRVVIPAPMRAGLSLSDRACLALGHRRGLPAITADQVWGRPPGFEVVLLPR